MKLSIIITHYNEPWRTVKPMFDSLSLQRGIDWKEIEIIVVQDGEDGALERHLYAAYGLPVSAYTIPHGGVSTARNHGLDEAQGEYVMWCDCDDMFCQAFGLNMFMTAIKDEPDIIHSSFIEESDYKGYHLFRHENDMCFVHGKAFRKQFLIDTGIRFPTHIHKHEDGAMVRLAFLKTEKHLYISTPLYTWAWNPESVMRKNGVENSLVETYPELMKSREWFLDQLAESGMEEELKKQTAKVVFDCYYDFQKPEFIDPENTKYVVKDAKAFSELYAKYSEVYLSNDVKVLVETANKARSEAYSNGMQMEHMTIGQFIETVKQM
jgi:glycosyltransferase involved in cell wall biosynthesis